MLVNAANLDALRVGFKKNFQNGLAQASSDWTSVATEVPSMTKEQKYGWLGKMPNVREWIGARAIQNLAQHDYSIAEKAPTFRVIWSGPISAQMPRSRLS